MLWLPSLASSNVGNDSHFSDELLAGLCSNITNKLLQKVAAWAPDLETLLTGTPSAHKPSLALFDDGVAALMQLQSLKVLALFQCEVEHQMVLSVLAALPLLTHFTYSFVVPDWPLTSEYGVLVCQACARLTELQFIALPLPARHISATLIQDGAVKWINGITDEALILLTSCRKLQHLTAPSYIGDYTCFADARWRQTRLRSLSVGSQLAYNFFASPENTTEELRPLFVALSSLTVNLSLEALPHLTRLHLTSGAVSYTTLQQIAESCCATLQHLEMDTCYSNKVTDDGIMHLARCSALQTFSLLACLRVTMTAIRRCLTLLTQHQPSQQKLRVCMLPCPPDSVAIDATAWYEDVNAIITSSCLTDCHTLVLPLPESVTKTVDVLQHLKQLLLGNISHSQRQTKLPLLLPKLQHLYVVLRQCRTRDNAIAYQTLTEIAAESALHIERTIYHVQSTDWVTSDILGYRSSLYKRQLQNVFNRCVF